MTGKPQPAAASPPPLPPVPKEGSARPRPPLFRALGRREPPPEVEVEGVTYRLAEVLKHDSWAATAIYEAPGRRIVCKLNRQQPIWRIPTGWLGRLLASREKRILKRLADISNVPRWSGDVYCRGKRLPHAVAHDYVPGHPLGNHEHVSDGFFPTLRQVLAEMHRRGMAYVDLHKRENVLVGDDGQPYLIDFQISFVLPGWWPGRSLPVRVLMWLLQWTDDYHLQKLYARCRPDLCGMTSGEARARRPWWIRLHRLVAVPFRSLRRRLLVWLGIRKGVGRAVTEVAPEDAVRREMSMSA